MTGTTGLLKTRRRFLADACVLGLAGLAGAALSGCAATAHGAVRTYRLGIVYINGTVASKNAFLGQLRKLGYVEGQNIVAEMRDAGGLEDRLPELFAEILQWQPDVIYASGTQTVLAAKTATTTVPVVGLAADPVGTGIVTSLARPTGNITGVSLFANQLAPKRAQLLDMVLPDIHRVGVLYNSDDTSRVSELEDTRTLAQIYDWEVVGYPVRFKEDLDGTVHAAADQGMDALIVLLDPLTLTQAAPIANAALDARIPAMYGDARFANAGGLMGYSASSLEQQAKAADYVDKILKGAKPSSLAIQQPSRFDFILNMRTANALGIEFPAAVLERATDIVV